MASNPYVNKVEYGGSTVMDITDTTATEADVAAGKVFYKASGARAVGTATGGITLDDVYPVGSIYMSVNNTDPGTLFGGTWQAIEDTFLLAAGSTYAGGTSGGEASHHHGTKSHKLTAAESGVPAHIHETANSMVVYNNASSVTTRMATSGSGTKISLNTALANNLNTYKNTAAAASSAHTHGDTDDTTTLPPYLAVYVWKRVPDAVTYAITLAAGGAVESVDKVEAEEGETVTVTTSSISPGKTGYTILVKNTATGTTVAQVSGIGAHEQWSFTMPAFDVTIS